MTTASKILALLIPFAAGCLDFNEAPTAAAPVEAPVLDRDSALAAAAEQLSGVLSDPAVRDQLRARLKERAHGDYEVLFDVARDIVLADGRTLGDVLEPTGVDRAVQHLQIAAPGGIESWTETVVPRVTFVPADRAATELAFFDGTGTMTMQSADEQPDGPVLVLGPSERVDWASQASEETTGTNRATSTPVYLRGIMIWDDHEPWYKGDPEIYVKCTAGGSRSIAKIDLSSVNEEHHEYHPNVKITTLYYYENFLSCEVKEADDGDSDDLLGTAVFAFDKLTATSGDLCYTDIYKDQFYLDVSGVSGGSCPDFFF